MQHRTFDHVSNLVAMALLMSFYFFAGSFDMNVPAQQQLCHPAGEFLGVNITINAEGHLEIEKGQTISSQQEFRAASILLTGDIQHHAALASSCSFQQLGKQFSLTYRLICHRAVVHPENLLRGQGVSMQVLHQTVYFWFGRAMCQIPIIRFC